MQNSSSFSPKYYSSGWSGGGRGRITTYSVSKVGSAVSTGVSLVTTAMAYNEIVNGDPTLITHVDATVGTAGIISSAATYFYGAEIPYVGEGVALYGGA